MKKITATAVAVAMALSAGIALADKTEGDWEQKFNTMDTDTDGRISREEFTTAGKEANEFDRIDANRDGYVSKDEKKNYKEEKQGRS